jgi:phosphate transport system permease protein
MSALLMLLIAAAALAAFIANRQAAASLRARVGRLHSMDVFHGAWGAMLVGLPAILVLLAFIALREPVAMGLAIGGMPPDALDGLSPGERSLLISEVRSIADGTVFGTPAQEKLDAAARLVGFRAGSDRILAGLVAVLALGGFLLARRTVLPAYRARQRVERVLSGIMIACALIAILTTIGITLSLVFEAIRFFERVPLDEFLFGLNWEPQIPIRDDQVAGLGAFGWIPVLIGTLVVTFVALLVAIPIGIFAAIYLNEFAPNWLRTVAKPVLEILAGIPTIVYGFFAILTIAPALRAAGEALGIPVAPNTALAAGGVMGIMLIPFISSFTDDALSAVPRSLRDGSLALGATQGETVMKVLFPAAIPGIVGGVLLAVSRAIGETMIVVMAAGLIATLTINPLDSVTTVTVQIVTLLIGDTSFDNPKTLAAFALGLMLFLVTLGLNVIALGVVRKYREVYD